MTLDDARLPKQTAPYQTIPVTTDQCLLWGHIACRAPVACRWPPTSRPVCASSWSPPPSPQVAQRALNNQTATLSDHTGTWRNRFTLQLHITAVFSRKTPTYKDPLHSRVTLGIYANWNANHNAFTHMMPVWELQKDLFVCLLNDTPAYKNKQRLLEVRRRKANYPHWDLAW